GRRSRRRRWRRSARSTRRVCSSWTTRTRGSTGSRRCSTTRSSCWRCDSPGADDAGSGVRSVVMDPEEARARLLAEQERVQSLADDLSAGLDDAEEPPTLDEGTETFEREKDLS